LTDRSGGHSGTLAQASVSARGGSVPTVQILRGVTELAMWHSQEELQALLDRMSNLVTDARCEWDAASGEEWAAVVVRDRAVLLLRAPMRGTSAYRFAFLLSGDPATAEIHALLVANDVEVVELEDFDAESLSARPEDLTTFTGTAGLPPSDAFDPGQFSANDLYFFTN
jgi:hypothetical protein